MKTFIIILFLIIPGVSMAQTGKDIQAFDNLFAVKPDDHKWTDELKESRNELTFIFSTVFVVYKEVFSSQDIDACVFTPSCSVYAIESIKQEGVVKGYLNALDRLTRCNPVPKKNMPVDMLTGKYFDPVEPVKDQPLNEGK
ncbi:MAG TPA: membrane protein insertion efficiency factor YidD [Bacteroidales bacterium]|nr:membrane protein insertion efficiency factor YidD [Bacteroidales bacterium]